MREILFRGKRTDTGEWIEGAYIQVDDSDNFCYIFERYNLASSLPPLELVSFRAKKVIPETIGQYTGLTDKNGKRVFEGDILQYKYSTGEVALCVATWVNEYAMFTNEVFIKGMNLFSHLTHYCNGEVIGNIHDNPELLKTRGKI